MRSEILVINPGSTSTKVAMYGVSGRRLWGENISHSREELAAYDTVLGQTPMRQAVVLSAMERHGSSPSGLRAVVSRGGLFASVQSGAYLVNEKMLDAIQNRPLDQHASNTGACIAWRIARSQGIDAYIYDAVTVDEMIPVTRITGLPGIERFGRGHNLNMRAAAIGVCKKRGMDYYRANILVAHLGGGITLSLHRSGRIVDMISDDEGPFSPERAGGLPCFQLIELCYSGAYTKQELFKLLQRSGGLAAHFGTADSREIEKRIAGGDEHAGLVYEALALNVAKNLAKLAVVVNGRIDCVILTGGIAHSEMLTGMIAERVAFLGPLEIVPGEYEMQALYEGVMRVLNGQETAHIFA